MESVGKKRFAQPLASPVAGPAQTLTKPPSESSPRADSGFLQSPPDEPLQGEAPVAGHRELATVASARAHSLFTVSAPVPPRIPASAMGPKAPKEPYAVAAGIPTAFIGAQARLDGATVRYLGPGPWVRLTQPVACEKPLARIETAQGERLVLAESLELGQPSAPALGPATELREEYGPGGDLLSTDVDDAVLAAKQQANLESARMRSAFAQQLRAARGLPKDQQGEAVAALKRLEAKYTAGSIAPHLRTSLLTAYMDAEAWPEAIRFYEQTVSDHPTFSQQDVPTELYMVALNKAGRMEDSLRVGLEYLAHHESSSALMALPPGTKGEVIEPPINGEVLAAMGKAYREAATAARSGQLTERMKTLIRDGARREEGRDLDPKDAHVDWNREATLLSATHYERGFSSDFHNYQGMSAIYEHLRLGNRERAEQLVPLVKRDLDSLGGTRSDDYYVLSVSMELALVTGDAPTVVAALPKIFAGRGVEPWRVKATLAQLEGLAKGRTGADAALLQFVIAKYHEVYDARGASPEWLKQLEVDAARFAPQVTESRSAHQPDAATDLIERSTHSFAAFMRSDSLGGNVPYKGTVPDMSFSREGINVSRDVLRRLGLSDVTDFETFNARANSFLDRIYELEDAQGNRPLEDLHSAQHLVMDEFRKALLDFTGTHISGDSRTDVVAEMAMGRGDCRHVAYSKQLLFDVWKRDNINRLQAQALDASAKNRPEAYRAALSQADELNCIQLVTATITVEAPIEMIEMYQMKTDSQGRPLPSKQYQKVEEHTLSAVLRTNPQGQLESMKWTDGFYQQLYQWGDRPVDLSQALDPRGFDGGLLGIYNSEGETVPVRMRFTPFSAGSRSKAGGGSGTGMMLGGNEIAPVTAAALFEDRAELKGWVDRLPRALDVRLRS